MYVGALILIYKVTLEIFSISLYFVKTKTKQKITHHSKTPLGEFVVEKKRTAINIFNEVNHF